MAERRASWLIASSGGMLIELRAESGGPACAVVGIGLNVALGAELLEKIRALGLPATDLASAGGPRPRGMPSLPRLIEFSIRGLHSSNRRGCGRS